MTTAYKHPADSGNLEQTRNWVQRVYETCETDVLRRDCLIDGIDPTGTRDELIERAARKHIHRTENGDYWRSGNENLTYTYLEEMHRDCKKQALQTILRWHSAPVSGSKVTLIARLAQVQCDIINGKRQMPRK